LGDGQTAVIELAAASGIMLTTPENRKPLTASTYGTGELILAAIKHGCKRIIAGIGASACTDGGAGMAQALGAVLTDAGGRRLPLGGLALNDLAHIDITPVKALLSGIEITAAWSVNNPLCGGIGTATVYSPGKGATPDEVILLDRALNHYADIIKQDLGTDVRSIPGGGCGGGTGAGMYAFMGARLVSGFRLIVEETGFEEHIPQSDYIITGEGCTEQSTLFGKVPMGIAQMAKAHGVPVIILSGSLKKGWRELYKSGVTACFSISDGAIPLEDAMQRAEPLLYNAAEAVGRLLTAGLSGI
jgi:glycerate kinase